MRSPAFWKALCDKVGLPELADDERYDSVRKRALHVEEIVPKLRTALALRTALEWETVFGEAVAQLSCSRVFTAPSMR